MRKKTTISIGSIVAGSAGKLAKILQRARLLETLNSQFNQYISQPLGSHCQLANLRDKRLVVLVDSPVWASRLRYEQAHLLNKLRLLDDFPQIDELSIQVKPSTGKQKTVGRRNQLTAISREHIQKLANEVGDPKLRESLSRLAARGKNNAD